MLPELVARANSGLAVSDPSAIDVTPQEAWAVLQADANAQLIDVRTPPEWAFVGTPKLDSIGKKSLTVSWRLFPAFDVNANFAAHIAQAAPAKDTPLFFLCRTGGRSLDAALAMRNEGYTACFNIAGGFEGDLDGAGHRGTTTGWKAAGLAWEQN